MSGTSLHAEWLSLLDVSGPFLALPVLNEALPQGVAGLDADKRKLVRQAYAEWCEAFETEDEDRGRIHDAWIDLVIEDVLSYRDAESNLLERGAAISEAWKHTNAEHGITLAPDCVLTDGRAKPLLLIVKYPQETRLDEAAGSDRWPASPIERMVELCRATGVRLGLLTNGERWALVDATLGVTSVASWYARYWSQEPITLQAFVDLLGVRRFFAGTTSDLPALLDKSLSLQDEVTDALGEQVRRAVEVLVQALDRADQDRNRELLKDVSPGELYEAGLTIMMRIVFLLSAEERGLLLMGDETYEANYAASTLRLQLRNEPEEILERRWDAWSRLLSLFRAIFAGIEHDALRLPALGGSLFDPDRFPFLEGRTKSSHWKTDAAVPLPIDNRTVLLLLEAVQLFQGRALSYLALDVEQIGYVYEGLLERTVVRATEVTLDLAATKNADNPWVTLSELEDAAANGDAAVQELLVERTGSSPGRIRNALAVEVDETSSTKLLAACQADPVLRDRVAPYFHLLRTDSWGYPLVYPKGTFMVASGSDRRETGTHYTPKSFTESIVKTTLEPLVYEGPSQGAKRVDWKLKTAADLLDLKVCDPAMGSGAFLVQVCRYLSERLVEAWGEAEAAGKAVSADGDVLDRIGSSEPMSTSPDERQTNARRLIAERCLYGVDMNPLAVELAKLSIWLVTLAKGRPFGFLDHNLRGGDSLLGITSLDQLVYLDLKPGSASSKKLFAATIDQAVDDAVRLRMELRARPIRDIRDVQVMAHLDEESRRRLKLPTIAADGLIGMHFLPGTRLQQHSALLSVKVGQMLSGDTRQTNETISQTLSELDIDLPEGKKSRKPFNWCLEFPEVFKGRNGFDAVVGNPPFLGGRRISGALGKAYERYLKRVLTHKKGSADLCAYFFIRAHQLCRRGGCFGLLATNTIAQTDTREIGLRDITTDSEIYSANPSVPWPGSAAVFVSVIHIAKGQWNGRRHLAGTLVGRISTYLRDDEPLPSAHILASNKDHFFGTKGTYVHGAGFVLADSDALNFLKMSERNADIVKPYLVAKDFTTSPDQKPTRWVIDFGERDEAAARGYPELFAHLERTVKPNRDKLTGQIHETSFWKFWDKRAELYSRIERMRHVIVCPEVSKYSVFALIPNDCVFSHMVNVIASESFGLFACLQSSVHGAWAWYQGSTMKNDLRYTTRDCLDTFPFPSSIERLDSVGEALHRLRSDTMSFRKEGLTKIYNKLHDSDCEDGDIVALREKTIHMDAAVFAAFSWHDLEPERRYVETPQGIRFSQPKEVLDEIIRRLLELNLSQHLAETQDFARTQPARVRSTQERHNAELFETEQRTEPEA
jgi:Eco57I restriction-modification methylase/MmeI, target recognition domain